ncbi:MAG: hypothetical protein GX442_01290 [Candidatus Riflebacteria bacterium]|nr:hypothetical protein [Candidatus Riflebacteria bacterium]
MNDVSHRQPWRSGDQATMLQVHPLAGREKRIPRRQSWRREGSSDVVSSGIWIFAILVCGLGCLGCGGTSSGYRTDCLPLPGFMGGLTEVSAGLLQRAPAVAKALDAAGPPPATAPAEARALAEEAWQAHGPRFRELLDTWAQLASAPLLRFPEVALASVTFDQGRFDLGWCDQAAALLSVLAFRLTGEGRPAEALRLLAVLHRFGLQVLAGLGGPPEFFQLLVGSRICRLATGRIAWQALRHPALTLADLEALRAAGAFSDVALPPLPDLLRPALAASRHAVLNDMGHPLATTRWNKLFQLLAESLAAAQHQEMRARIGDFLDRLNEEFVKEASRIPADRQRLAAYHDTRLKECEERRSHPASGTTLFEYAGPAVGELFLTIELNAQFPSAVEAHPRALAQTRGFQALVQAALQAGQTPASWPSDAGPLRSRLGTDPFPIDPFDPAGGALRVGTATDGTWTLYSRGPDGQDEGGDPSSDLILFP